MEAGRHLIKLDEMHQSSANTHFDVKQIEGLYALQEMAIKINPEYGSRLQGHFLFGLFQSAFTPSNTIQFAHYGKIVTM